MEEVVEMEALKIVGDVKSQNRYCERVFSDFPQGIALLLNIKYVFRPLILPTGGPMRRSTDEWTSWERSHAWRVCFKGCRE